MRILFVHNHYRNPGGEDVAFRQESQLLREHGHDVFEWTVDNQSIKSGIDPRLAVSTIWSRPSARKMDELIRQYQPQVVHLHNTFPLISPSVYYVCQKNNIPVVQTLHNFRIFCPAAILFRSGHICEDCIRWKIPIPSLFHICYRHSFLQTAVSAAMSSLHRVIRTYQTQVNAYIALSEHSRKVFIRAGLPPDKIRMKPNFISPDPGAGSSSGQFALYAGRLEREKGIATLLNAWKKSSIPLKIIGDGNLRPFVLESIKKNPAIEYLGPVQREDVFHEMKKSRMVILPSEWYEGFPMTALEAMACGVPIIASRLGVYEEIIRDSNSGVLFSPASAEDLRKKVEWLMDNPGEARKMGTRGRNIFEERYSADRNYLMLEEIYRSVLEIRI